MDFITAKQMIEEEKTRALHVYPRKHIVCISGCRYYKINAGTLNKYKYYKKTGHLIQDK